MTNSIALVVFLLVAGLFAFDAAWLHWGLPVLVGRAFVRFVEWVSFWR